MSGRSKSASEMVTAQTGVVSDVPPVEVLSLEWRRLERRTGLGVERDQRRPWYASAAITRRLEHELKARPTTWTGSYGRSMGGRTLGKIL